MLTEIGKLKTGDTYAENRYRVLRHTGDTILIKRHDNWLITFHDQHPSWIKQVKKDDNDN